MLYCKGRGGGGGGSRVRVWVELVFLFLPRCEVAACGKREGEREMGVIHRCTGVCKVQLFCVTFFSLPQCVRFFSSGQIECII